MARNKAAAVAINNPQLVSENDVLGTQPKIAVAITCYNKERFIAAAIDSALLQSAIVVVIDDASADRSWEIISGYKDIHGLRQNVNQGAGAATVDAIEFARKLGADFVALLDGDDVLAPQAIEHYASVIDNYGADAIYSGVVRSRDQDMRSESVPCNPAGAVERIENSFARVMEKNLGTTAVCAKPSLMLADLTRSARIQDYQLAFSLHRNAKSLFYSSEKTHYSSQAEIGKNLSEDHVAILSSAVVCYSHVFHLAQNEPGFKKFRERAFHRALRLRRYKVYPGSVRTLYYILTPFKKLFPGNLKHKVIVASSRYV
jgi:glycosyltransferase involved in cell wall biosynthesis